jgi:hypothetical protein
VDAGVIWTCNESRTLQGQTVASSEAFGIRHPGEQTAAVHPVGQP